MNGFGKEKEFVPYLLSRNCRNTKYIVKELADIIGEQIEPHEDAPLGHKIKKKTFKTNDQLKDSLSTEVVDLIMKQGISPNQILIMLNSSINKSSIAGLHQFNNKIYLKFLKDFSKMRNNVVYWTTIKKFKGLERNIIFILDKNLIEDTKKERELYTQISRAQHKVYIYSVE